MFRNAFADGYEAITGKKYYRPKALTTKEEVIDETEAGKERLIKRLQRRQQPQPGGPDLSRVSRS
jgi:hypothetical protein